MTTVLRPPFHQPTGLVSIIAPLLSLCLLVSGCTTMQTVPLPGAAPTTKAFTVRVGDEVEILTKDGRTVAFKVTAVESDAFVGAKVRVKYSDISTLKARRLSKGYTAVTVGAILTTLLIGLVIYALAHAGPGLAGG